MDCAEYLARASEHLDGVLEKSLNLEVEAHLAECAACRGYHHTLTKGVSLFRSLPDLDPPGDFNPRLQHRIYHLEDGARIAGESLGSGVTTAAVLAMAFLFTVVAWSPRLAADRVAVELPAVVVARPPSASFTQRGRRPTFSRSPSLFSTAEFRDGIWGDPHQLLFEYSPLSQRHRGRMLSRTGVQ